MTEKFTPPEQFRLDSTEQNNPIWLRLKAHLEEKLKEKRGKNDDLALDPIKTAAMRGHIECLKGLLSLGDVPPIIRD
jgi:hypothetical protein